MNVEEYKVIVDKVLESEWRRQHPAQQDAIKELQWKLFKAWAEGEVREEVEEEKNKSNEIDRLANFIMGNYGDEIGLGDSVNGESAVDVAIRLLKKMKEE